jgi:hypothetical protein
MKKGHPAPNPPPGYTDLLRLAMVMWRSIVIISIPKSGTNMTKLLLANYLNLTFEGRSDVTTYDEMHTRMFYSDVQVRGLDRSNKPGKGRVVQRHTPYRHVVHTHGHGPKMRLFAPLNRKARYLLLYRNPLDNLISSFFYHFRYRPELADEHTHPRQIIDQRLPLFIKNYSYQRELAARNSHVRQFSYESLFLHKAETFTDILGFLDIPVNPETVEHAVEFSSLKSVREQEKQRKKAIHQDIPGFKGSFVRSGKVGQWKEFFSPEDVARIKDRLAAHQISLDEFVLE